MLRNTRLGVPCLPLETCQLLLRTWSKLLLKLSLRGYGLTYRRLSFLLLPLLSRRGRAHGTRRTLQHRCSSSKPLLLRGRSCPIDRCIVVRRRRKPLSRVPRSRVGGRLQLSGGYSSSTILRVPWLLQDRSSKRRTSREELRGELWVHLWPRMLQKNRRRRPWCSTLGSWRSSTTRGLGSRHGARRRSDHLRKCPPHPLPPSAAERRGDG
jgi:hypothetical protein